MTAPRRPRDSDGRTSAARQSQDLAPRAFDPVVAKNASAPSGTKQADGETCAGYYAAQCASGDWSAERRACVLAAADLLNAHLCGNAPAPAPTENPPAIPPALACPVLGAHLATIMQGAGMHEDVPDMNEQIAAACEIGAWSVDLRECFSAATSVTALTTCIAPLLD